MSRRLLSSSARSVITRVTVPLRNPLLGNDFLRSRFNFRFSLFFFTYPEQAIRQRGKSQWDLETLLRSVLLIPEIIFQTAETLRNGISTHAFLRGREVQLRTQFNTGSDAPMRKLIVDR